MLGDIVGYATINRNATTGKAENLDKFIGKDVRVFEFNDRGDVLCISNDAIELGMFDACDIYRKFECTERNGIVMPPKLDIIGQTLYAAKVMARKGGYSPLLKAMVIQASLMKGKFMDSFLWAKQEEEARATAHAEEKAYHYKK